VAKIRSAIPEKKKLSKWRPFPSLSVSLRAKTAVAMAPPQASGFPVRPEK